jgi:hypothetical protein
MTEINKNNINSLICNDVKDFFKAHPPIEYTVYKIVCNDPDIIDVYVGSTKNFYLRRNLHKSHSTFKDLKLYKTIRENGGWDNWSMIDIETLPCQTQSDRSIREKYWYDQLNSTLNTKVPNRKFDEYLKEEHTCICGSTHTIGGTTSHKRTKKHNDYIKNKNIQLNI